MSLFTFPHNMHDPGKIPKLCHFHTQLAINVCCSNHVLGVLHGIKESKQFNFLVSSVARSEPQRIFAWFALQ